MPRKEDCGLSGGTPTVMSIILTPRFMPMRNLMRWSSGISGSLSTFRAGSGGDNDTHPSDPAFTEADQQIIARIKARLGGAEE